MALFTVRSRGTRDIFRNRELYHASGPYLSELIVVPGTTRDFGRFCGTTANLGRFSWYNSRFRQKGACRAVQLAIPAD